MSNSGTRATRPNGDRLTESRNGGAATNYNYTANRLNSLSGAQTASYGYDHRGNMTSEVAGATNRTFQYDFLGRMRSISNDAEGRYRYDSRSLRVKSRLGATARAYVYNLAGQLIEEVDSVQNKWQADYVYLNGRLLAKLTPLVTIPWGGGEEFLMSGGVGGEEGGIESNAAAGPGGTDSTQYANVYYYHLDHLGTPWFMTNKFQTSVWEGEYFPFGELYTQTMSEPNAFRFPGQYDDNTGMYYNWHRYYESKSGRYRQSDPIGVEGGLNVFGYAEGNAVTSFDETGLSSTLGSCAKMCALKVIGLDDLIDITLIAVGQPIPGSKPFVVAGSSKGTSDAAKAANWIFGKSRSSIRLPSVVGGIFTGRKLAIAYTKSIAKFTGRAVPIIGWGLLAWDVVEFGYCVNECVSSECGTGR